MTFQGQRILPALRDLRHFEKMLGSKYKWIVLLEVHLSNLKNLIDIATECNKKVLVHADLIQGLKGDDYGAEFLCHVMKPAGIISTRTNMIVKAKAKGLVAIQRTFLLDTIALEKSYSLIEKTIPDFIEVLPGIIPEMIDEVRERTGIPIISGGLIRTPEQVETALTAGSIAVTTSNPEIWKAYNDDIYSGGNENARTIYDGN